MKEKIIHAREYRETLLRDPYRPMYHFTVPDDFGYPADPNGAFFVDGVYHLMYLYVNSATGANHWGHISSVDLLHWRHHPDALTDLDGDEGCYSGGAFLDEDKTAYLTFWKFPGVDKESDPGGIAIAHSKPPYEEWTRMDSLAVTSSLIWGVADLEVDGEVLHLACADPSNIWKMNGRYYMQAGNLLVLSNFGKEVEADEKYKGDFTDLFRSDNLRKWEYVGRFYANTKKGIDDYPDVSEDDMCPSFLPLFDAEENGEPTGKYMQLFISHRRGCQYYIGTLTGETFLPEIHGRMSWCDKACFAPEALVDDRNRHIMWAWLQDNPENDFERYGWTGVYSAPRTLWYAEGELKMAPVWELEQLEYAHIAYTAEDGETIRVENGESCRIRAVFRGEEKAGLAVRVSEDGEEYTEIYYSPQEQKLIMDTTRSGSDGWRIREEAPFALREGEKLHLDILIDKSVVEVYANQRQAICRRIYPTHPEQSRGVKLLGERPITLDTWAMFASNPY